jgi:endonuclease-3
MLSCEGTKTIMSSNRSAIFEKLYKTLKKHYRPIVSVERPVLETLLFACCLENARYDLAEESFARIQESFFDWNEVRVTTVKELSELMQGLPDPAAAAANLKHVLHSVFETHYEFNLESLRKQNLGVAIKNLEKLRGTTPFSISYVVQHALGGHSIPLCKGSLDVMLIISAISQTEYERLSVPGLERAIPKNKGIEFGSLLHQLGAELIASPFGTTARNILLEIDPDAKQRLPKRASKKAQTAEPPTEPLAAVSAPEPETKQPAPAPPKADETSKPQKKKRPKAPEKLEAKKSSRKPIVKKATKSSKKSRSKQLSRRKPR